ncbi:Kinesin motor domain-containing protein [Caenorhabditis elegans]|uniref:Kinesin motor domain-containing protein n=1 Tax=Caenorhabditis elegans TaxID=6239 RepID=Q22847_CAEEL|nr:Kinesin motor domain-containing protein [Caenorhabditis elegans]CAA90998.4 Kinesin motor domain-containing protein [Caenorhabditis elegans]|eukprot:NP_001255338.1 Uncharacterized protein CELE_T28C6.7 [Caenorhabditis elegans]
MEDKTSKEKEKSADKRIDERVHQQLVYKDNRIIDLNNVILDKERQILDLQERVREHNEVASVKNQAMRIVQQKFEEMNRDKKDMSTETEPSLMAHSSVPLSNSKSERRARSSSPGHVIAQRKTMVSSSSGTFSPPPLDPPFDPSSKLSALPDIDGIHRKHQRKRVTFDLNPNGSSIGTSTSSNFPSTSVSRYPTISMSSSTSDALESALTEASSENALLRQQVIELNSSVEKMKADYESEILKYTKEAKTAGLKAKVAATARIKELETTLEDINGKYEDERDRLQEEVDTLRSSRNWEIEQNALLRDQVAHLKEKVHKLTTELDASEVAKRSLSSEVDESKKLMELMVEDLLQAESAINYNQCQKKAIFEDIDRLKDAIQAQDRFIEVLEADIVIYEQHIGLLRENLGASQVDHRALIKSKAFETKLLALEREKEQSDKKSNEDRLKTKALDKKCRVLVEQNEQLMARLCELEMSHGGADETRERRLAEQEERIRQISSALESERDVGQRLREAKEVLEKELMNKKKTEEASNNRFQRDVEMSRMEAQNKIEEMSVEVDAAHKKVNEVLSEVEQLRATNFDLQMHIETAKRTMEELADCNEELEKRVDEYEEAAEEKDEDLKQSTWDVETLTRQNEALRVELDGVRQGFHETRELADEVKHLRSELQRQQEIHRAQFDAACREMDADEPERKTSLEVQQDQYILAYEEKIRTMSQEMEALKRELELKNGPVQRKTTQVLEPPSIEQIQMVQPVQMTTSAAPQASESSHQYEMTTSTSSSEKRRAPVSAPLPAQYLVQQSQQAPQSSQQNEDQVLREAHENLKRQVDELKKKNADFSEKMMRLEMEAKLSGELNVELGRAMLELEEHNELLQKEQEAVTADDTATSRELELHVLMVQEMTEQIASMHEKNDEMEKLKVEQMKELEKWKSEAFTSKQEAQRVHAEVQRLLHALSESELARKSEFEQATTAHDAEIREFSIKMEDARRDIADLEAKLQEAEEKLKTVQVPVEMICETPFLQETRILTSSSPLGNQSDTQKSHEAVESSNTNPQKDTNVIASRVSSTSQLAPGHLGSLEVSHRDSNVPDAAQMMPEPSASDLEILQQDQQQTLLHSVSQDMNKLIELKDELEIAVQALKAEIWSLNGQLKASILDREGLEDKVTQLDDMVEKEKKRAIDLDVELQEQIDLTDRAVRRAAEAENESNQRMAECLEKETRREEIEKAYTRLNEYYNQLQEAYNNVYAQLAALQAANAEVPLTSTLSATTAPPLTSESSEPSQFAQLVDGLMTILLISQNSPSDITISTHQKLEQVGKKLKQLLSEYEENQNALDEQRKITEALEKRLQASESARDAPDDVMMTKERVEQLEGEIEWKEEECEGLKRRIRELEKALEAVAERADETEAAAVCRLSTELAILAAKLTTRQADVDSLFRTNAELAHTNVRLQNEVDEQDEWKAKIEEEKEQLEQHVKELEDQVAELMEQHETHFRQAQLLQSATSSANTENISKVHDSEKEVQRLSAIEKILNNRILALEDQNLELEEKYQEMEDEMLSLKQDSTKKSEIVAGTSNWEDSWDEKGDENAKELVEARNEVERLLDVEKALTLRMEMLQIQNVQLESRVREQEDVNKSVTSHVRQPESSDQVEEDDWGWGEEKEPTTTIQKRDDDWGWDETQEEPKELSEKTELDKELQEAKSEIGRLVEIEKVLNNRILSLEDQNLELEERLQEMEEELLDEKNKKKEVDAKVEQKSEENWGDWGEDDAEAATESNVVVSTLQSTVAELQDRLKFQKEVIEKAEAELIETQEKYDELEQVYEQSQQAQNSNKELIHVVENLKSQMGQIQQDRDKLMTDLVTVQAEKLELEKIIQKLEVDIAEKEQEKTDNDGWNDEDWREDDQKETESEKLTQLRNELTARIEQLESQKSNEQAQMSEKLSQVESMKVQIEQKLYETREELDDLKKELKLKEIELQKASEASTTASSEWNDDGWNDDDGEIDRMKDTQKVLEMKVEALQDELQRLKDNEIELTETISALQSKLYDVQSELEDTKQKLVEAENSASGWNDDDAWNKNENEIEEVKKALEIEISNRNDTIVKLQNLVSNLRQQLIEASESADLKSLEELEQLKEELRIVSEQNGLLKDSEARLLDHADEFAVQMDKYREKCEVLTAKIAELEAQLQNPAEEDQQQKTSNVELVKLRQQLANAQQDMRVQNLTISDREGLIAEYRHQIAEQTKTIEELHLKLKTFSAAARRTSPRVPMSSNVPALSSRPSSRMSTSSRISTASSFVPESVAVPLQSTGSAFDVVVRQSGEPLRRRNK